MQRSLWALLTGLLLAPLAQAQDLVPERRLVVTQDVDFYGSDLQALFDTTLEACRKLCLDNRDCAAFTFNTRSNACFPKSQISDRQPYEGAISAQVVTADPAILGIATARKADLDFLEDRDLDNAAAEAAAIGLRHSGGEWSVEQLLNAARNTSNLRDALNWTGSALAQTDTGDLWLDYGSIAARYAETQTGNTRRVLRDRAVLAAINGYLRSPSAPMRQTALLQMADALETVGRGRTMIPALRLAEQIGPRADIGAALDDAIGKYGFRIVEHIVEADSSEPRLCADFSDPLIRAGQDYAPYVRLPDPTLAVRAEGSRLCITGVTHGERYDVTFRAGLPSASGEALIRDVALRLYVRDRTPTASFPGRAYVLPRGPGAGLPLQTVNLDQVDLTLRRVSDRNLIRAIQEDFFARPLNYWREQLFDQEIAEEIWRGTAEVENALNRDVTTRLPIGEVIGDLPAGIYALAARVPGREDSDEDSAMQWFVLSDIGLTTLHGSDGLTIFARSLGDASALSDLTVELVSRGNRVLGRAQTDADGVARFEAGLLRGTGAAAPAMITARQGEADIAFLSLTDPAFDLSDRGVAGRAASGPIDAFLTPDRGAYRAGEVIHVTALMRDARASALAGVPATLILSRPDGVEHARVTSADDRAGGHVFTLPLAPSVPRGTWRLALHADPKAPALVSQTVLVEDFVPERIDVTLSLPDAPISPVSPPLVDLTARYLFGAPGADLAIEGELRQRGLTTLDALPGYRFGRHDEPAEDFVTGLQGDLRTDAGGRAQLALPVSAAQAGQPHETTLTVRVTEGAGRPVERSITRPVLPAGPMIGLKPEFDSTLPEGGQARFLVQGFGPDLQPVPMQVAWQINRVRTHYQWYQLYGNWNWEPVTSRETVATGTGSLGTDPLRVTAPVTWGEYELVVERTDGAYVASSAAFEAGWYAPADAVATPDTLDLSLDRPAYRAGDIAVLRIVPRHAGQALVTVLSDRVIAMQAVEVGEGETLIRLPVTEEWGSGAYVTATVLRPGAGDQSPGRALGLAHAAIDPGARHLDVTLDAPAESAPRGPLQAGVRVDAPDGAQAFVTVAAVDLGILNLTGFADPDPALHYFGQRRLGVEIRDLYGRLIDGQQGALGRLRSGGDAADRMRLQSPPPTEALVAFHSGLVAVQDGRAQVSFDMPDFNGTVRLMAVAWTAQGVGQAAADVLVRDPVVISAALPRFLAPGDAARLRLDLSHTTGPAGDMSVLVEGVGDGRPIPVAVAPGQTMAVDISLTAGAVGDRTIRVALTTPDGQTLTKTLALGVRANDPQTGATRRFQLAPGQTFTLDAEALADLRPATAEIMVSAGPLARFDAAGMLRALDRYPYGCTEQITSQSLPLLYLSSLAEPLGLGNRDRIGLRIGQAIERVLTRQGANGAFGLWSVGAGDFWLDAYVTDFLTRARMQGHPVPDRALDAALDNLANRIAYAPDFDSGGEDIAYALFVLAREGRAAVGDLRYYADERADAFATPLAQAQLGAALAAYGDQRRADALFAKAARRIAAQSGDDPRLWRADYGSTLRDAAGVLSLAVEAGSTVVDRDALTARIATAAGRLSPQEQAWSLLAAHALVQDPTVSGLSIDGAAVSGPFMRRIPGRDLTPMRITNTANLPTDITLTTLGVPAAGTEVSGTGYSLTREYFSMDGRPVSGPIRIGDRLVAVLSVRPAEDIAARLMIDDPLPAGFEIDNPSLLRAGDVRALDWLETTDAEHAEFRTDRFLAAVNQQGNETIRLAYIVRAVSPGDFHHPAAVVEDMYRPDYRATTASSRLKVLE
ncbi:alpha-2-macroglobulin family protein [Thalassococcus sp. CAU 1522]|uniref:Alpha-2-macroglobulin family protein n=1 Tax=Thalassococcus arenae TaxID=2851652 RepID=A0ABS6N5F5_9RHOB|nr:alpha-2-macroglobulin family protein [Thalassococcus arenae]MBV2359243.1 alpha-2-macroglobulin family protein [Thalassococcus arenae]